jgi:hypothetical protein
MGRSTVKLCALVLCTLGGLATASHAAVTIYGDRATWTAAMGGSVITESFESSPVGEFPNPTTFPSGLTCASTDVSPWNLAVEIGDPSGYQLGNTTTGGEKYVRAGGSGVPGVPNSFGLVVDSTTTGLAFDLRGWQPTDTGGSLTVKLYTELANDPFETFQISSGFDFGTQFIGFTSTVPFWGAEIVIAPFRFTDAADVVSFDEVSFVPAPGSAALLGLAVLGAARRRRG